MKRTRQTALAVAMLAITSLAGAATPGDLVEQGRRIYQEGVLPDGAPLTYYGAGSSVVSGKPAACGQCHRRSGLGSREGILPVSPITGPILFTKPTPTWPVRIGRQAPKITPSRQDSRDAYDDASLARAIRAGVDSLGRPLHELMPRYVIDDAATRALTAYLRQLSAAPTPGIIGNHTMHLATIITPDADPLRKRVVVEALSAWAGKGGISRVSTPLQIWQLEGPESSWGDQLRRFQRQQPVFAVISGAGAGRWQAVRDFCEQATLPCLFPIVDHAPSDPDDYYSFYFSNGITLEARMLAKHLQEQPMPAGRIVQIVAGEAGEAAARQLTAALAERRPETRTWRGDQPASLIADLQPDDVLIAWLRPTEIRALTDALPQGLRSRLILFSNQLAPADKTPLPSAWREPVRWVSLRSDPQRLHGKAVLGLVPWSERFGLKLDEEALLAEVYAATYYFNDALARTRGRWNPAYLAEMLESSVDNKPVGMAFYGLSLGPGQRVAAKGGHLLGYAQPDYQRLVPLSPRIVP